MTSITDQEQKLSDITRVLNNTLHPRRIWLLGSRSAETHKPWSDFDIAIEGHNAGFRDVRKAKEQLDQVLGIYSVDLIELEKTGDEFRKLVREEGKVVYERD